MDEIEGEVGLAIKGDVPLYKKVAIYCSHQFSGASLNCSMSDSAVSQSSRRFTIRTSEDKGLQKIVEEIRKRLGNVKC